MCGSHAHPLVAMGIRGGGAGAGARPSRDRIINLEEQRYNEDIAVGCCSLLERLLASLIVMQGEEIGRVLCRSSELRSKLNQYMERCGSGKGGGETGACVMEEERVEDEAESLNGILDALESLEQLLADFQAVQQQQRYEREATLSQIDSGRLILLGRLKEYEGEDLDVIREASIFAGGTIEHDDDDDDLLLPPYPSLLPDFVLDGLFKSRITSQCTCFPYALSSDLINETKRSTDEPEKKHVPKHLRERIRFLGTVAKSVLTFVGALSILSLAGFELKLGERAFKMLERLKFPPDRHKNEAIMCPPGKILVIEAGKPRCLVKERIEMPFEADVTVPKASYGLG